MSRRCAVLCALPLDREGFDEMARGEALRDYASTVLAGGNPTGVWEDRYAHIAMAAQEMCAAAAAFGAEVVPRATRRDVARAAVRCDTLVIVAHWRGARVDQADLAPAEAVLQRLTAAGVGDLLGLTVRPSSTVEVARALNRVIASGALLERLDPGAAGGSTNGRLTEALGRDVVDELLDELITPGNKLELHDGLHTPGDFADALGPSFVGEIDLSTCCSVSLATVVSIRLGSAVTLVHTQEPLDPQPCCLQIAETFRILAEHGGSYAATRLSILEGLQALHSCKGRRRR